MRNETLAILLALSLAGCGSSVPAGESDTAANTPAAKRVQEVNWGAEENAAGQSASNGASETAQAGGVNQWAYKEDSKMAVFGPPESEALLAIHCTSPGELTVTRYTPATQGANRMLTFKGQNNIAGVAVTGEKIELAPGLVWQGTVPASDQEFRRAFSGTDGTIMAEVAGGSPLQMPIGEAPLKAIDACS